jgi:hypothetical protein
MFSMDTPGWRGVPWWRWLYQANRYGFWLSLGLIVLNAYHFLTMRIPV